MNEEQQVIFIGNWNHYRTRNEMNFDGVVCVC